jgi:uncharacterized surface protein with fasciclin (FAS1) repeats
MIMTQLRLLLLSFVAVVVVSTTVSARETNTILETAVASGQFKTLAALLDSAELTKVLEGDGPFTVFAPTDDAFAKLPKSLVNDLTNPRNRSQLASVLKYHVIGGNVGLSAALKARSAETLGGSPVTIRFAGGRVKVNDADLLEADIVCSNGRIHIIDSVLLPPEPARKPEVIIAEAIERGVPLFNRGKEKQCADVYLAAATELVEESEMQESLRKAMKGIKQVALESADYGERAWILRHGFDMILASLH